MKEEVSNSPKNVPPKFETYGSTQKNELWRGQKSCIVTLCLNYVENFNKKH